MRPFALLLLWSLVASAQTAKPEESSTIEGRVLNAVTGEPVGKVVLLLTIPDSDGTRDYDATTDAIGKFAIRNIDPGKYRLRATRNGFVTLEYGARSSQPGTVLALDPAQQLKDVELRLTPHGVIAGRILDADGEPMHDAQVQLLRSRYVNGKKTLSAAASEFTNDLGEYRWSGLAPGKYFIYAEGFAGLTPATAAREQYVPVYYPGASNSAGAVPLNVTAGAQVRAGDMMLRKAPALTVKGRVVIELPDTQGTPSVRFFPQSGHDNSNAGMTRSPAARVDAKGQFEIRGLTRGSYIVMAEIAKGGVGVTGRTSVDVTGNLEGVVVTIGNGVSMTGRIRIDGESPPNFKSPSVKLQPGGPAASESGWHYGVAPDNTFKIDNLDPDRYGILLEGLPDGFYTKSIHVAGADVLYLGVDLMSGAPGPVDILLSPKAGMISGVAQNPATAKPATNATVVMVPKEKERQAISSFYRQSATDQYGRFTFKNLAPGDYKVYAWEDVEPGAWMDPDFMKPLEAKGEAVTVTESGQASVQVKIIPAD